MVKKLQEKRFQSSNLNNKAPERRQRYFGVQFHIK